MGMNPDTNRMEQLHQETRTELEKFTAKLADADRAAQLQELKRTLLRPDGTPVPQHWSTFRLGEHVVVNGYTFKIAYVGETSILLEPVSPALVSTSGAEER
jgi:hypothetical protein